MDKLRKHIGEIISISDDEFETSNRSSHREKSENINILFSTGIRRTMSTLFFPEFSVCSIWMTPVRKYIVQFAGENWWMADYQAYFKEKKATLYITCMEDAEVLCLTLNGREAPCAQFHQMEHFFRLKLTNAFVAQQRRIISLLSGSPQQRYEEFGQLYPHLMQKIPKKYIAEYLGVSRETLSRLYSEK